MDSRERMQAAMGRGQADRVPVMFQLSIGHYFLNAGIDPLEIWCGSEAFADALVGLQRRYGFDGILVNLPGRPPQWRQYVERIVEGEDERIVEWTNGNQTVFPAADNPTFRRAPGTRPPDFERVDPASLGYVEPWGLSGVVWGDEAEFGVEAASTGFPSYQFDTIREVLRRTAGTVSVHGELFSPWSQFMELFGYEQALLAIMDDPEKVSTCLEELASGAARLGLGLVREGIDALLISSAFAGGGFISRRHYREFVLPAERTVIEQVRQEASIPIYTHTCGRIGDRLELMLETGTDGIDTLDPPPLGNVDLEEAKGLLAGRAFIKGNIDAVNTLLQGSEEELERDVRYRLEVGKPGGGYILSTACSVAPATAPERIERLRSWAERFGSY